LHLAEVVKKQQFLTDEGIAVINELNPFKFPTLPKLRSRQGGLDDPTRDFVDSILSHQPLVPFNGPKQQTRKTLSRHELTSMKIAQNIQLYNSPQVDRSVFNQSIYIAKQLNMNQTES
jgi:hypothetical protein